MHAQEPTPYPGSPALLPRVHLTVLVSRVRGDGHRAARTGTTIWPEASSLPRVESSPQPPSKQFPGGLTINPQPLPRGPCFPRAPARVETRNPLVMPSEGPWEQEAERGLLRSLVWEVLLEPGELPQGDQ